VYAEAKAQMDKELLQKSGGNNSSNYYRRCSYTSCCTCSSCCGNLRFRSHVNNDATNLPSARFTPTATR
jgi:hypothetical protein